VIVASYPIVVTDKLHECRDFYTRWFGLSFTHSEHPSTPPEPAAFTGDGMFLTLAAVRDVGRRAGADGAGAGLVGRVPLSTRSEVASAAAGPLP
jgi:catechol 2,3-dioxygenase-like lactoylglutathione lyase family enzyme